MNRPLVLIALIIASLGCAEEPALEPSADASLASPQDAGLNSVDASPASVSGACVGVRFGHRGSGAKCDLRA